MPRESFNALRKESSVPDEALSAAIAADDKLHEQMKKDAVHKAWVWTLRFLLGCAALIVAAVTLNVVFPPFWRWIPRPEVEQLATAVVGTLVGYMVRSIQKYL